VTSLPSENNSSYQLQNSNTFDSQDSEPIRPAKRRKLTQVAESSPLPNPVKTPPTIGFDTSEEDDSIQKNNREETEEIFEKTLPPQLKPSRQARVVIPPPPFDFDRHAYLKFSYSSGSSTKGPASQTSHLSSSFQANPIFNRGGGVVPDSQEIADSQSYISSELLLTGTITSTLSNISSTRNTIERLTGSNSSPVSTPGRSWIVEAVNDSVVQRNYLRQTRYSSEEIPDSAPYEDQFETPSVDHIYQSKSPNFIKSVSVIHSSSLDGSVALPIETPADERASHLSETSESGGFQIYEEPSFGLHDSQEQLQASSKSSALSQRDINTDCYVARNFTESVLETPPNPKKLTCQSDNAKSSAENKGSTGVGLIERSPISSVLEEYSNYSLYNGMADPARDEEGGEMSVFEKLRQVRAEAARSTRSPSVVLQSEKLFPRFSP